MQNDLDKIFIYSILFYILIMAILITSRQDFFDDSPHKNVTNNHTMHSMRIFIFGSLLPLIVYIIFVMHALLLKNE